MLQECIQNLPILFLCMAGNIAAGTLASMTIDQIKFDKVTFVNGICKAVIAGVGIIILAYAFDKIDLSSIGFQPNTVVNAGIIAYAAKLGGNVIKLLNLSNAFNKTATLSKKVTELTANVEANTKNIEDIQVKKENCSSDDEPVG